MNNNPVDYPSHYTQGKVECIDAIEAALGSEGFLAFLRGQVIKYVWCCNHKGAQLQDLEKAAWYLARAKQQLTPPPMVNTCDYTRQKEEFIPPPEIEYRLYYYPILPKWVEGDVENFDWWTGPGWYVVELAWIVPPVFAGPYESYTETKKQLKKLVNKA